MRVGAIQMNAGADPGRNLETADRLVRAAAEQGATLVVLPEKWSVLGTPEDLRAGAQTLDGPAIRWVAGHRGRARPRPARRLDLRGHRGRPPRRQHQRARRPRR